jgi:hypothetical protein
MRYFLLTLSAVFCVSLYSCSSGSKASSSVKEMSAKIKRNSSSDSAMVWKANPNLVYSSVPFKGAIKFNGSDYQTLNTNLTLYIHDFNGTGTYNLYQGTAQQTDSNYAMLTYQSREYHTIKGKLDMIRSDNSVYIANFTFIARSNDDTITVTDGHFTVTQ